LFAPNADSYRVLGVAADSAQEQLRENYRWLMKWLHPDRNQDGWEAVYADRVNIAWQDMKTPERRAEYDRHASAAAAMLPMVVSGARRVTPPAVHGGPLLSGSTVRRLPALVLGALGVGAISMVGITYWAQTQTERELSELRENRTKGASAAVEPAQVVADASTRAEPGFGDAGDPGIDPSAEFIVDPPPPTPSPSPPPGASVVAASVADAQPHLDVPNAATVHDATPVPEPDAAALASSAQPATPAVVVPEPVAVADGGAGLQPHPKLITAAASSDRLQSDPVAAAAVDPSAAVAAGRLRRPEPPAPAPKPVLTQAPPAPESRVEASSIAMPVAIEAPVAVAADPAAPVAVAANLVPQPAAPAASDTQPLPARDDAEALVREFAAAYAAGDLARFDRLFSGSDRRAAGLSEMRSRFISTEMRYLEIQQLRWQSEAQSARARAAFKDTYVPRGERRAVTESGTIEWVIRVQAGDTRIASVDRDATAP
ncbi:MAG TPA: J domain-containing protein, partial [Xanthomonadales bacterium]|nr:J domain-containing protein [Xanthomonadales bacterium]